MNGHSITQVHETLKLQKKTDDQYACTIALCAELLTSGKLYET